MIYAEKVALRRIAQDLQAEARAVVVCGEGVVYPEESRLQMVARCGHNLLRLHDELNGIAEAGFPTCQEINAIKVIENERSPR